MEDLYKQLGAFQQECPVIGKTSSGYNYKYADFPSIVETIKPLLKKHDLGFTQILEGTGIRTVVFSTRGNVGKIEGLCEIPQGVELAKMNVYQVMGSAYTYYRRYALSSILGIVTDEETDVQGSQVAKPIQTTAKPANYDLSAVKTLSDLDDLWGTLTATQKATYKDSFGDKKRQLIQAGIV